MESNFGIRGHLSEFDGFSCVLKQRYEDFVVNEIDNQGRIVRLTKLDWHEEKTKDGAAVKEEPSQVVPWNSEIEEKLRALSSGQSRESVVIPCKDLDKLKRTEIHNTIRERYPNLASSSTNGADGIQSISVTRGTSDQLRNRKRRYWPCERGDYVRFVLYKENEASHSAVAVISRLLGLKSNSVGIAGTKDRRGVTAQLATVYRTEPSQLAALNGHLRGIRLGNFEYCTDQTFLGDSRGNRFTVVMRNVQADREKVENGIKLWSEKGFINFYGSQRFGTTEVATHTIGRAILKQQWADVVDLLLKPREDAPSGMAACYNVWEKTKDPGQALQAIPSRLRFSSLEGNLLHGLKKHGIDDFPSAFRNVSRNSRTLYVHALQSYIWNTLISKRVAKYGQKLFPGDSISTSDDAKGAKTLETDEDAAIEDPFKLLVPLPSANAEFKNEEMSQWFEEILSAEGLTRDDFKNAEKEYSVYGDRRLAFIRPADVEYAFFNYDDPTISLITNDLDRLNERPEPMSIENGKHLALRLAFSLPPGSYATMAIRELCRMDTGKQHQSTLNDYSAQGDRKVEKEEIDGDQS